MTSTRNILLFLTLLNIVSGGALWFGYTEVQNAKSREAELRKELAEEEQKSEQIDQSRRVLSATEVEREELGRYLLSTSDEDQIKFISSIEQMGTSTSGAVLETKTLELTKAKPPTLRASFTIKGSWGQVFHALRLMEESPSRVNINRFDVKGSPTGEWDGEINLEVVSLKEIK